MFLDLFNDFSHVALSNKLKVASELYKSTPSVNVIPASTGSDLTSSGSNLTSSSSNLTSSGSDHSSLGMQCDSGLGSPSSHMTTSMFTHSSTMDLSPPSPTRGLMTQSMCDLRPVSDVDSLANPGYQGSREFHERVDGLKDRLATLLESNYNRVISPPDTTSSYIRNLRLRKQRPLGGGRVFTVFSRAMRKPSKYGPADNIVPMHLGRRV